MAATRSSVALVSAEYSDVSSAGGASARPDSTPSVAAAENATTAKTTISPHLLKRLNIAPLPVTFVHETEAGAQIFPRLGHATQRRRSSTGERDAQGFARQGGDSGRRRDRTRVTFPPRFGRLRSNPVGGISSRAAIRNRLGCAGQVCQRCRKSSCGADPGGTSPQVQTAARDGAGSSPDDARRPPRMPRHPSWVDRVGPERDTGATIISSIEVRIGKGQVMRHFLVVAGMVAASLVGASQAGATTAVPVSVMLTEPLKAGTPGNSACPDIGLAFNCGSGVVFPFGRATEEVNIGVCGDTCNIREIDVAQGSIVLLETATDFSCPGVCGSQGFGPPATISLTDVVIDGTGIFAGATGTLDGAVEIGGWHGRVQLTGTITLSS